MFIKKVRVMNYKSIEDSGYIELHENITILAGRNNVGKTAFIEALYKLCQCFLPGESGTLTKYNAEYEFMVEYDEATDKEVSSYKCKQVSIGLRVNNGTILFTEARLLTNQDTEIIFKWNGGGNDNKIFDAVEIENSIQTGQTGNFNLAFFISIIHQIRQSIIYISSNRSITAQNPFSIDDKLNITASNLPAVLYTLHNNDRKRFDEIEKLFISIFPEVDEIETYASENTTLLKLGFYYLPSKIPLDECGTGYAHVLIMICVLLSGGNRIILFDEPHAFLHPSAEKAVYDLVSGDRTHQFVFTTHSPILINYPMPKTLYLVTLQHGKSNYVLLDDLQIALKEIGVSNSDFALADKVIFVEGPTENLVLPLILKHFGMEQLGYNYKINIMNGIGKEFTASKTAKLNFKIHDKVFKSMSLSPIPFCFLIDRDGKDASTIEKLMSIYKDTLLILGRCEIENYFLDPGAIVAVMNNYGDKPDIEDIEKEMETRLSVSDNASIKGSSILECIFEKYGLIYSKTRDGTLIVDYLLKNKPEILEEIAEQFRSFLSNK
jgi:predicted ATP-dependent endonuclease of OLD family